MNLMSIVTVLWYTVQPMLWLIALALLLLVAVQVFARIRGYYFLAPAKLVAVALSFLVGAWSMAIVPAGTGSSLSLVATTFDWLALTLIGLGVGAYCWLIVHPIIYLFRPTGP